MWAVAMKRLPEHVLKQLHKLIREGMEVDQIAFMMRLSKETVEAEKQRLSTTEEAGNDGKRVVESR